MKPPKLTEVHVAEVAGEPATPIQLANREHFRKVNKEHLAERARKAKLIKERKA
jgi:hypothetical protein